MNFTNETDFINDTSAFNETESDDSMALGQCFLTWGNLPNLGNFEFRKGNLGDRSTNFCKLKSIFCIFYRVI